ncbi:hypothetical protein [Luteimonas arsenica]|uniref:hypothetical protein n=1 Tax=Luteimonas arsenica TaxID=1586242 RepID=UPI001055B0FF|nr:hypothetical protein [Luteimonas arsenica]
MTKKKTAKGTKIDWQNHVRPLDWVERCGEMYSFKGEDQEDAIVFLASRFILTLDAETRLRAFLADEIAKRDDLPELVAKRESGYWLYDDEGKR